MYNMLENLKGVFQENELLTIPVFMIVLIISTYLSQTKRLLLILIFLIFFIRIQLIDIY